MTWNPDVWTADVRRFLYRRLVKEFGPFDRWEKTSSPGHGLDQKFDEFCEAFAKAVGANSGKAVRI